ncbi:polysaccharide deacetylase [Nocardioides vastitatis]|uniref:Polysaccharide deacetylase n=1 Tax=Nocardioides vastitatis TaxID=2568655 RepID=A0ABW0ZHU0_9ACTN|nr:polysaccharide deacetylase [Nocardioides sp.]
MRAGRSLKPESWPGEKKVAVAISFDSDHETIPLRDNHTSPGQLAQGEYGARAGVPRILDLLDRHGMTATFFMPAVAALARPDEAREYVARGHEVAAHGWIHERTTLLPEAAERDLTARSLDALERVCGVRPRGIRTPSWDFSAATLQILLDLGLEYDSSLMADDDPYELRSHGRDTGLVEIPVDWIRDDAPYFVMDRFGSARPYTSPRDVLGVWVDEFDSARADGGTFQLTLHPHVIGHRSRMTVLDELLGHVMSHGDVWCASHAAVADWVRGQITAPGE